MKFCLFFQREEGERGREGKKKSQKLAFRHFKRDFWVTYAVLVSDL